MTPYAKGTKVPISRTRNEIEAMLAKHGADAFGYATKGNGQRTGNAYRLGSGLSRTLAFDSPGHQGQA